LSDALAGDPVDLADLVEGARLAVGETEAQTHQAGLALGQGVEHRPQLILQQGARDRVHGHDRLGRLAERATLAVALITAAMVWSSEIGSRAYCWISSTFSGVMSISLASSSGVGSRPRSWSSSRWMRPSLLMTSTMCTGMRMVRAWSAIARVIACRIHQVA